MKKKISIITPSYNEEENIEDIVHAVQKVMEGLPQYDYEHILIDNDSKDSTPTLLKKLAAEDNRVKVILNARNFGQSKSPAHAIFQATGDAIIGLVADFQDPPEMIPEFLKHWEAGAKVVAAVKRKSKENWIIFLLRKLYYKILDRIAEAPVIKDFTGFGLYDKKIVDLIHDYDDPNPYFRGLLSDFGYDIVRVPYDQPVRQKGESTNNFFTLFDMALLGTTYQSKAPLRIVTFIGFASSCLSMFLAIGYTVYKILYWAEVPFGITPLLVGGFFFFSIQMLFLGLVGEYIASIHTRLIKKPLVIERERINFDKELGE